MQPNVKKRVNGPRIPGMHPPRKVVPSELRARENAKKPQAEPRRLRDDVSVEPGAIRHGMAEDLRTLTRRATANGPLNETTMVETVVVATDTPILRRDGRGLYREVLDPNGVDLSIEDVSLIDSHNTGSIRATLGRAFNFRVEGNAVLADIRISMADDVAPIRQRMADGTINSFSVGYVVLEFEDSMQGRERVRSVTKWRITEVSLVSNPADPKAKKRSAKMADDIELPGDDGVANAAESRKAIRTLVRSEGHPAELADEYIDADMDLQAVRADLFERQKQRSAQRRISTIGVSNDDPAVITRRVTDAMAYRMAGGTLPDDARPYVNQSIRDVAAASLERAGGSARGLSADDVFVRAAQHTGSDFPLIVSNAMNKVALDSFKAAESPLKTLARQRVLPNFKESTAIRAGELGRLEEMTESGEFTHTTRAESGEKMRLKTFGRAMNVSRKLLVDDDLNLLGDTTSAFGEAAAQTEADELVALLTENPNLSDGTAVYHASRGNVGTAAAITAESLGEARQAMRLRKGLDGKTLISATPKYLLVGADRETEAEKALASIYAAQTDDANVFAGKLTILVEPRIDDGSWFIFADPARLATMQYAYLSSAQGVQIQRSEQWDVLGTKFRAWLDFGCSWLDWRGVQYNEGD